MSARALSRQRAQINDAAVRANAKRTIPGILGALSAALTARAQLNAHQYDGILGQPPAWIPPPLLSEFFAARDVVLRKGSPGDVLKWMQACRALAAYPLEHVREVEALVYIQQIAMLGKRNGMNAYLGRGRHRVLRAYAEQPDSPAQVIAAHDENLQRTRRSIGGQNAADRKRASNATRDAQIRTAAERLLAQGVAPRKVAGRLAKKEGASLTDKQIRRILRSQ